MTSKGEQSLSSHGVDEEPRCWRCGKKLAEVLTRPWEITCQRCKARNMRQVDGQVGAATLNLTSRRQQGG